MADNPTFRTTLHVPKHWGASTISDLRRNCVRLLHTVQKLEQAGARLEPCCDCGAVALVASDPDTAARCRAALESQMAKNKLHTRGKPIAAGVKTTSHPNATSKNTLITDQTPAGGKSVSPLQGNNADDARPFARGR